MAWHSEFWGEITLLGRKRGHDAAVYVGKPNVCSTVPAKRPFLGTLQEALYVRLYQATFDSSSGAYHPLIPPVWFAVNGTQSSHGS